MKVGRNLESMFYESEYLKYVKEQQKQQQAPEGISVGERNKIIIASEFDAFEPYTTDHVFKLYYHGMVADICDQGNRWVGDITRVLSNSDQERREKAPEHFYYGGGEMRYPENWLYTPVCIYGTIQERLDWIKNKMIETTWKKLEENT